MSKPNKMPSGHSPVPIVPIPQNHEELFTGVATQSHTVYPESLFMMGFVWHLPSPIPESASASACARPDPLHIGLAETERSQSGNRPYTVVLYFYRDYTMYYTLMYIYILYSIRFPWYLTPSCKARREQCKKTRGSEAFQPWDGRN